MSDPASDPAGPSPEKPYGLDDLVRHEKRQIWFTALLLIGAVVVTVGRQWTRDGRSDPAPVGSGAVPGSSAR